MPQLDQDIIVIDSSDSEEGSRSNSGVVLTSAPSTIRPGAGPLVAIKVDSDESEYELDRGPLVCFLFSWGFS
jgi:hypothetical protein